MSKLQSAKSRDVILNFQVCSATLTDLNGYFYFNHNWMTMIFVQSMHNMSRFPMIMFTKHSFLKLKCYRWCLRIYRTPLVYYSFTKLQFLFLNYLSLIRSIILYECHFLRNLHEHYGLHIYTFVVSRAFMAGAASHVGDADYSRAPGLASGLQGPWMSAVVLYCWCHSDGASVLLYFTIRNGVVGAFN